ncbi:MAG: hypothetical protein KatS3mg126_2381 [Lysobacteraceae bacterium]|nr:MAG: hypothetical protein KatS3mg126_2381 [Xanthomonadaceae bacterium]
MRRWMLVAVAALGLVAGGRAATPSETLNALFAEEWERGLREDPLAASEMGDARFADRLPDLSPEAIAASQEADRKALARLEAIDPEALSEHDRINHEVFGWLLRQRIAAHRFRRHLIPLNQQGGIQSFVNLLEQVPLRTVADYENWIARLRAFDRYAAQTEALMRQGIEAGIVPPRVVMQRVLPALAAQAVERVEDSPFWNAFRSFPDAVPEPERERLRDAGRAAILSSVLPAYRRFRDFFESTYLPACSESIAASDLPDGEAYYAWAAGYYTTTALTPEAIHRIGLAEVERITQEMEAVRRELGFAGDLPAFFTHLRTDPRYFFTRGEDLLQAYRALAKRIDPELVRVFRRLPRLPYGVRPIPDNIAPDTYTAYYQPGAVDGSRAGYYYVNLYKPESRPKWEMMALTLHEAVPGHHFQFALGLELPEQPMFRRTAYITAYGEGWALYAERLGYDMGLYEDPLDRMGQLAYDMWRAVRLVVDTGIHAKGWSRQQAIDYFLAHAPKTAHDVVNEIDRYIAWPGQALAYKIGQLKISELRARAERELGARFDLRDFHDTVLATGSVPLSVLERHVQRWIARRKAGA